MYTRIQPIVVILIFDVFRKRIYLHGSRLRKCDKLKVAIKKKGKEIIK